MQWQRQQPQHPTTRTWRARGYITADARNQTAYGTVRAYTAVGIQHQRRWPQHAQQTVQAYRAFIQWAGFTFGQAQSFFDFYSMPATSYWGVFPASDTGDPGWMVVAYTAQFGNGFSATLSAEMRRTTQIVNANGAFGTTVGSTVPVLSRRRQSVQRRCGCLRRLPGPDIVGNLRVDQAWGSAQIMGAVHQVNAQYYGNDAAPTAGAEAHPP